MKQKPAYTTKEYNYSTKSGNLNAEAVGVVKGEKHFPVFEGKLVFKPLTKSKLFSGPLFAYAEVFWSWLIDTYFMPAPRYQLAFCRGYERAEEKYYDYGKIMPMSYKDGEHLLNLLEFFRKYSDPKVHIDDYVNYCQMFYDYTDILEAEYFKKNREIAEELALQILVSILKGDQNYHYENIAFVCGRNDEILRLAPMIDHEFSTYFMFPDNLQRNKYWFEQLQRSIRGEEVRPDEYDYMTNKSERQLMEKSAVCLHKNLLYIKKNYPKACNTFLKKLDILQKDIKENKDLFSLKKASGYPDMANSDAYLIGKAKYKDHDEKKSRQYEELFGKGWKEIDFETVSNVAVSEIQQVIQQIILCLR